jgi:hypothetical protein
MRRKRRNASDYHFSSGHFSSNQPTFVFVRHPHLAHFPSTFSGQSLQIACRRSISSGGGFGRPAFTCFTIALAKVATCSATDGNLRLTFFRNVLGFFSFQQT